MDPGTVVDGRFQIVRLAGTGGMGWVYQAIDQHSGQRVAVKLLPGRRNDDAERFVREASILAELGHPHIVRYVADGVLPSGEPYLAMEWLEGEDLAARLQRGRLGVAASVELALAIGEALDCAHDRGIVHRDLKPSNVFLVGGRSEDVRLLDFGVAMLGTATRLTATGASVGTPGYMAPEQVRAGAQVDARADVFSLGCVLFECLAGEPAFWGPSMEAILIKILFEQTPHVRDYAPEVPAALEMLVSRMLAKDPAHRPSTVRTVTAALRWLRSAQPEGASMPLAAEKPDEGLLPRSLTASEQRAVAVLLVGAPKGSEDAPEGCAQTVAVAQDQALEEQVASFGGTFERLADGSGAVLMTGKGTPTDLAAQAARCALALRALVPDRPIALALGRRDGSNRRPTGKAIDRVSGLFKRRAPSEGMIVLDEVAAGLLDARFDVRAGEAGLSLHGERELGEGARLLLGKATPCVGRERELRMLGELLDAAIEEGMAQAVLVTAPPGVGKSRLVQEFLRDVRGRAESIAIWMGRSDPLRMGSAFGLLAQILGDACGLRAGEPLEARREKILGCVAAKVAEAERERVAEMLGEIVGAPFPDDDRPRLLAARKDAPMMSEQLLAASLDFLAAERAANPVLIVLEDLHWGDRPTVQLLDRALRERRMGALFVLAVARPEVHEVFPSLWRDRIPQEIRLKELSSKAIERLVRHALGERATPSRVERIAELSEGNAFYLEELIRATVQGEDQRLPETLVAMVEARLGALDEASRRALRAASVFGEVFWSGAVAALLGSARTTGTRDLLAELSERELVVARRESRFPGEVEYAFRHALLREGAYAMLTDQDRTLGHALAGRWLEEHGEADSVTLAEHFGKGMESGQAAGHWLRAAERALLSGDVDTTVAYAKRASSDGAADTTRIAALGLLSEILIWGNAYEEAAPHAEEVFRRAPAGTIPWARGAYAMLCLTLARGDLATLSTIVERIREVEPSAEAVAQVCQALVPAVVFLDQGGLMAAGALALRRLSELTERHGAREPALWSWEAGLRGLREAYSLEDPWGAFQQAERAISYALEIGHRLPLLGHRVMRGMNLWFLGAFDEAERELSALMEVTASLSAVASYVPFCLAGLLADRGAFDEARRIAEGLVDQEKFRQIALDRGRGHWALAGVLARAGELAAAELEIRAAEQTLACAPLLMPGVLGTRAAILLADGRYDQALAAAEDGLARYESIGACGFFRGASLRLTHAECLAAAGKHDAARAALAEARARLLANATKIAHPDYRRSFLENVPENTKTLALAGYGAEPGSAGRSPIVDPA